MNEPEHHGTPVETVETDLLGTHTATIERRPRKLLIAELGEDGKPGRHREVTVQLPPHQLRLRIHRATETSGGQESSSILTPPPEVIRVRLDIPDGKGGHTEQVEEFELEQHRYRISLGFEAK